MRTVLVSWIILVFFYSKGLDRAESAMAVRYFTGRYSKIDPYFTKKKLKLHWPETMSFRSPLLSMYSHDRLIYTRISAKLIFTEFRFEVRVGRKNVGGIKSREWVSLYFLFLF